MPKDKRAQTQARRGRERRAETFARQPGARAPQKSILIVCEGSETEPIYFRAWKHQLKLSLVEVHGEGRAPITVVEQAYDLQQQRAQQAYKARRRGQLVHPPFDEVWCVFDVERVDDHQRVVQAIATAQAYDFKLAISNPAFEYWYLLHFEDTSSPFHDADEVNRKLKHHIPSYAKSLDIFKQIAPNTELAIQRAERLLNTYSTPSQAYPNPSTTVYQLVRLLQSMAVR